MAVEGKYIADTIVAGQDLSSLQYFFVTVAGSLATSNANAFGVLQNKPQSGEHGSVAYQGKVKVKCGGAIAIGGKIAVSSGYAIAASSGDLSVGIMGRTAAASGDVQTAFIQTLNKWGA